MGLRVITGLRKVLGRRAALIRFVFATVA